MSTYTPTIGKGAMAFQSLPAGSKERRANVKLNPYGMTRREQATSGSLELRASAFVPEPHDTDALWGEA